MEYRVHGGDGTRNEGGQPGFGRVTGGVQSTWWI